MVPSAAAYPWSSYFGNAALRADPLLTPHCEYLALGFQPDTRQRAYAQMVADGDADDFARGLREATEFGYPLVGERLRAQLEQQGVRLERGRPGRPVQGAREPSDCDGRQRDITNEVRN